MKVRSKWVSLQTAIRKLSLLPNTQFCIKSKRDFSHVIVRGNHGEIKIYACISRRPTKSYLIANDFLSASVYRVVEDPELVTKCLEEESK